MTIQRKLSCSLIIHLLFVAGCHTFLPANTIPWQPLYNGIDHTTAEVNTPRLQKVYVVRIDLTNPNIEFISTPANGARPLMTDGERTSEFLSNYGCKVAINANPFSPVDQTRPRNVLGLAISKGQIVSRARVPYPSLLITRDNHARIADANENSELPDVWTAVSGFSIVLSNGTNIGDSNTIHPRTAAGISRDNRFLFLMVIDGRQPGYSEGATLHETAEWLKRFGAHNGLNLDGGGSSTIVVCDKKGDAVILNRPIHLYIPGNERIVGNNLGIIVTRNHHDLN